jgi:hypothetical protein
MKEKNNRGGAREGAGRKTKAEELKVQRLGLDAIESVYGSIEKYYIHIAKESKDSFPHLKLLQEYVFGKPKETIENINRNFEAGELTKEEVEIIKKSLNDAY